MRKQIFKNRTCSECGKRFKPLYANQKYHRDCFEARRKHYLRGYQRKLRRELKSGWGDEQ